MLLPPRAELPGAALCSAFGVTRIARVTGLDRTGVEVACAVRPGGHVLQVSNGKGRTFAQAARSALSEAAELAECERVPLPLLKFGTPDALAEAGLRVLALPAPVDTEGVVRAWVAGRGLASGKETWVPAQAVYCPPAEVPLGPALYRWTSNGVAAHPARAEALRHALREVVERDQLARALPRGWTPSEARKRHFAVGSLPAPVAALVRQLESRGFAVGLFDLRPARGGLGVPVAGALLVDRAGGPVGLTAGYAASARWDTALEGALREAAQSRLTDIHGAREDVAHGGAADAEEVLRWLARGGRAQVPPQRALRMAATREVSAMVHALMQAGLGEPVAVVLGVSAPRRPRAGAGRAGLGVAVKVIAFLGPSLSAAEAKSLLGCEIRPPARQGDVFRALPGAPDALVLLDGVFETVPSVWHHELLSALDAGVAVFGASSMGALRASELHAQGMRGVGKIFEAYRDGRLVDDAEVALLHAPAELGFRALTVPLVQVRAAAAWALGRGVLSGSEARALVRAAEEIHYQDRTWAEVLGQVRWSPKAAARWRALAAAGLPDPKAEDARACLREVARWCGAKKRARSPSTARRGAHSALVRHRRLMEDLTHWGGVAVSGQEVVSLLRNRADGDAVRESGMRRKLLAGWGRSLGIQVDAAAVDAAMGEWLDGLEVSAGDRQAFLDACGLDPASARALAEEVALERRVLALGAHLLADGPSPDEALAAEARLSGLWADGAQRLVEKLPAHPPASSPGGRRRKARSAGSP